jgi:glycosyltransferase involved in cell wall biosynthesis
LKYALASAADQDFDDYEVVVSDNNSSDDTKAVIEAAMGASERIKYFNPGSDLSMCDNWENALTRAQGRYILLLCDDDALPRISLSYIYKVISKFQADVLVWRYGSYSFADFPDEQERLKFTYPYTSGKVFSVSSQPLLDALLKFDWSVNPIVPKMLNCVVSRTAIDVCRQPTGKFFLPPYPDFSAAGQLLATNRSYYFVDVPLYVSGASNLSNAAFVMKRKKVFDDYLSLYGRDLLEAVQYPMRYLCTSYFQAGWQLLRRTYPEVIPGEIDLEAYVRALFKELTLFEDYEDLSEEFAQIAAYMRAITGSDEMFEQLRLADLKDKARAAAIRKDRGVMGEIKERTWSLLRKNEKLYRVLGSVRGHRITEASFARVQTILAAARILEDYLQKYAQQIPHVNHIPVKSIDFLETHASA